MDDKALLQLAHQARKFAYAPYSNFLVGAALEGESGQIVLGCNVENSSYGAGNCAERTAFFKAISEGEHKFSKIAIVGGPRDAAECSTCYPCGICRQVMMEFCDPEQFVVILEGEHGSVLRYTLKELLPFAFT